jgi:hypothetical protein
MLLSLLKAARRPPAAAGPAADTATPPCLIASTITAPAPLTFIAKTTKKTLLNEGAPRALAAWNFALKKNSIYRI